jgi:hypothetical protein
VQGRACYRLAHSLTWKGATIHSHLDKKVKSAPESLMKNSTGNCLKKFSMRRAALITLIGAFIAHSVAATMYYYLNRVRLLVAADTAVRAGGEYLPSNPH